MSTPDSISLRLQRAAAELRELDKLIRSSFAIDSRVMDDFRKAVDHVRLTAWGLRSH